jgi:hypothetical protein
MCFPDRNRLLRRPFISKRNKVKERLDGRTGKKCACCALCLPCGSGRLYSEEHFDGFDGNFPQLGACGARFVQFVKNFPKIFIVKPFFLPVFDAFFDACFVIIIM